MPRVSVLMSVHNGERYLREAIESILSQTFLDFEFIIVDDASRDGTPEILEKYAKQDERVRLLLNFRNRGLTRSLIRGLNVAQGEYLARQDADDLSLPTRLERQVDLLEHHPEVDVVGTWSAHIDVDGRVFGRTHVVNTTEAIREALSQGKTPFCHGSVMMRTAALEAVGGYDESFPVSQDFELWHRMLHAGRRLVVLEEELYQYRLTPNNCEASPTSHRQVEAAARALADYGLAPMGSAKPPLAEDDLLGRYYLHAGKIALHHGFRPAGARYFWEALRRGGAQVIGTALVGLACTPLPSSWFRRLAEWRSAAIQRRLAGSDTLGAGTR